MSTRKQAPTITSKPISLKSFTSSLFKINIVREIKNIKIMNQFKDISWVYRLEPALATNLFRRFHKKLYGPVNDWLRNDADIWDIYDSVEANEDIRRKSNTKESDCSNDLESIDDTPHLFHWDTQENTKEYVYH